MLNVFGGAEHQAHFVLIVVLLALRARLNVIVVPICVLLALRARLNVISVPIYFLICVLALRASVRSTLVLCTSLHGLALRRRRGEPGASHQTERPRPPAESAAQPCA